ncbi:MAG: NTP transferase domain-containing protein [Clostridia bacterium]|nr:NTP transferase domain-containing protein [Clostridia bacterium]
MEKVIGLVMAAGTDEAMKSKKSKLAQELYGKAVIKRVVDSLKKAGIEDIAVIVGENKEEIHEILKEEVTYLYQEKCLGTGHAIMQTVSYLEKQQGRVVIANGNIPLVTPETIEKLVQKAQKEQEAATVLTGIISEPTGYGRIIRQDNKIVEIIEEKELTGAQANLLEINAGLYCFEIQKLLDIIGKLEKSSMGLYYLTDVIKMLSAKGEKIGGVLVEDNTEILRLNTKVQLEMLSRILRIRINTMHMNNGVTIEDMNTTYIYDDVEIGIDTVIHPNTTIKSGVIIGEDCNIGPNAYIREGCILENKVKVGSFVEIKKAIIREGSKVPHLSYMGDCEIGTKCNIGCGTITCNYDGKNKHKTKIGDNCFIGSNVNLVAPVTLGDHVLIAAGSTITKDVPAESLGIARQRQENKEEWNKGK